MFKRGLTKTNILFCGDSNVKDGIMLSCLSLRNNTERTLNIYILTASLKTEDREYRALDSGFSYILQSTLKQRNENSTVTLIDISSVFCSYLPSANLNTRFTPLCMLRLFADGVDAIPDKILYLDCDVLCRGGFEEFYDKNIENVELVGVPDRYGKWFFGRPWKHDYFNSGVLLLNMKKIRESELFIKCRKMCRDKKMFMPDQSALNKLALKEKAPSKYNCQGKIKKNTVFKHFTTFFKFIPYFRAVTVKPWELDRVHSELKIFEFDALINEFQKEKEVYENRDTDILYHR